MAVNMELGRVAELMKFNVIPPEALSDSMGAEFSPEDLLKLKEIPLIEPYLLSDDPYQKFDKHQPIAKLKNSYILCPMPDKMHCGNKTVPMNVFQIIQHFGFAPNQLRKFFFINNSKKDKGNPVMNGWEKWFLNEGAVQDHPIYRTHKIGWIFIRKSVIQDSVGKNLKDGSWKLRCGDTVPTLLEVLVAIIGFYFSIKNSKKKDGEIGVPFYIERDWFARILSGSMTWTTDLFSLKENLPVENLTIGFNTPDSGINIEKTDPCKSSEILGILPLRRLNN